MAERLNEEMVEKLNEGKMTNLNEEKMENLDEVEVESLIEEIEVLKMGHGNFDFFLILVLKNGKLN